MKILYVLVAIFQRKNNLCNNGIRHQFTSIQFNPLYNSCSLFFLLTSVIDLWKQSLAFLLLICLAPSASSNGKKGNYILHNTLRQQNLKVAHNENKNTNSTHKQTHQTCDSKDSQTLTGD